MRLSPQTIRLLTNFARINPGIHVKPGSVLMTTKWSLLAIARTDQVFPVEFALNDVPTFLRTLKEHGNVEIRFENDKLVVGGRRNKTTLNYADPAYIARYIVTPQIPKLPSIDVEVEVSERAFNFVRKSKRASLGPHQCCLFIIEGDGKNVTFGVGSYHSKECIGRAPGMRRRVFIGPFIGNSATANTDRSDIKFKVFIPSGYLEYVLPGRYKVSISKEGTSYWVGSEVSYFMPIYKENSWFGLKPMDPEQQHLMWHVAETIHYELHEHTERVKEHRKREREERKHQKVRA
jgi:hypothetical protein